MAGAVRNRAVRKAKFERCVREVKKDVQPFEGRSKKSSAIAICTSSLGGQPKGLQRRAARSRKRRSRPKS